MESLRCTARNKDFQLLVKELDEYLAIADGQEHDFYNQYNGLEDLNQVVVIYSNKKAVACGAFKCTAKDAEIKRMYCQKEHRRKGYSSKVLQELEVWAKELGAKRSILETGKKQVDAIAFYQKLSYQIIPNYGPYKGVENSLCFSKELN